MIVTLVTIRYDCSPQSPHSSSVSPSVTLVASSLNGQLQSRTRSTRYGYLKMTIRQYACRVSRDASDVFASPSSTCQSLVASKILKLGLTSATEHTHTTATRGTMTAMSRPSSWWIGVSILLLSDSIWTTECFTASPSIRMTQPWIRPTTKTTSWSPSFLPPLRAISDDSDDGNDNKKEESAILTRLNGWLRNSKISNLTISKGDLAATPQTPVRRILSTLARVKDLHNPITYLLIAAYFAIRVKWLIQNPYFLFAVGFCIKWYRARYVFKIPVWDRQPNWNNIITSREQEKDLKAYTCKKCGSTIFIAKTREFFFEGNTGIGGLGCFTCGAKGMFGNVVCHEERQRGDDILLCSMS